MRLPRIDPTVRAIVVLAAVFVVALTALRLPQLLATVRQAGVGPGEQPPFHLDGGTRTVRWVATDLNDGADGCLFGLRLTWLDPPSDDRDLRPPGFQVPKLAYRFIGRGETWRASFGPRDWPAGTYQLIVDGGCGWQVSLEPAGPLDAPVSPMPDNPRLNQATR